MKISPKSLRDSTVALLGKLLCRRVLCYNLCWLFLLIVFFIYLRLSFSGEDKNQVENVKQIIDKLDNDSKLEKLNQISEKTPFEISAFPYFKKYLVSPNPPTYGYNYLYIMDNLLAYKNRDTNYSVYNLNESTWVGKGLKASDNTKFEDILTPEKPTSKVLFYNNLNSRKNKKDSVLHIYELADDSNFTKYYLKLMSNVDYKNKIRFFRGLTTEDALYSYNESYLVKQLFYDDYSNAQNTTLKNNFLIPKSKIIGITEPNNEDSGVPYIIILGSTDDKTLAYTSYAPEDADSVNHWIQTFKTPYNGISIDNTRIASVSNNSGTYLGMASTIRDSVFITLMRIQDGKTEIAAQYKAPDTDGQLNSVQSVQLISKGKNFWMICSGKIFFQIIANSDKEKKSYKYDIVQIDNGNLSSTDNSINYRGRYNLNAWLSESGYCSLVKLGDNNYHFQCSKNLLKENKDDLLKLKALKNFKFYPYQNDASPTFIGISNSNQTIIRLTRSLKGKIEIKLIDGINWDNNPFTAIPTLDYYYIIILVALVCSAYFIGLSLLQNNKKVIDEGDAPIKMTFIPSLNRKINDVKAIADSLKLRSNLMLILGILFGIGGVVSASILFTMTSNTIDDAFDPKTIVNIIRPILLLVFIETFTFFFLKQYRVIFNEFKLFYSIYLKLFNYLHTIEMYPEHERKELINKLNSAFLHEKFELYERKSTSPINEFDNANILKIIETISNIKKGG